MNMFRAFMELDEAYSDRQYFINELKKAGKNYNFSKYTDAQLFRMWQRLQKPAKITKEPEHDLDLEFEPAEDFDCCDFCGTRLTDFGQCPVCDLGEEDLFEGIFDEKPFNRSSWVSASGKPINIATTASHTRQQNQTTSVQNAALTNGKYLVGIVSDKGRLRALSNDGVHGVAFVAFPNNLRQYEGQRYEVDQLILNGKNYRVAGNIVEI